MEFTSESQIVKDYLLLLQYDEITLDDIPSVYNLKEIIQQELDSN